VYFVLRAVGQKEKGKGEYYYTRVVEPNNTVQLSTVASTNHYSMTR